MFEKIINWFKERSKKEIEVKEAVRVKQKEKVENRADDEFKDLQCRYDSYLKKMLKSPCPINDGNCCFEGCVHFEKGNVKRGEVVDSYRLDFFESDRCYIIRGQDLDFPSCKLWRE